MKATLVFPITQDNQVLLGLKMRKVGAGKWNGYGGKEEPEDQGNIRKTATRELFDETGKGLSCNESDLEPVALIEFYFADNHTNEPSFHVAVYFVRKFSGQATKTAEMDTPTPFDFEKIPYHEMLPADKDFIPKLLRGETFFCKARFNQDMSEVTEITYQPAHAASLGI